MKRVFHFFLAFLLCLSAAGCQGKNQEAYNISKSAYESVNTAYEITERFGSDLYEAWRMAIYDDDEILEEGVSYLAKELSLSEDELRLGIACIATETIGTSWDELTEEKKQLVLESADEILGLAEDELFSFCVMSVVKAYEANGDIDMIQESLTAAKSDMKQLSENYSDYEHYPTLKEYYTTTNSFFDFCQNPTGSFDQVKDTINNYRNQARDCVNDLDYIFEDEESDQ